MRVYGTSLTTVEAVRGRYFQGSRRMARNGSQSWLRLFQKEL